MTGSKFTQVHSLCDVMAACISGLPVGNPESRFSLSADKVTVCFARHCVLRRLMSDQETVALRHPEFLPAIFVRNIGLPVFKPSLRQSDVCGVFIAVDTKPHSQRKALSACPTGHMTVSHD